MSFLPPRFTLSESTFLVLRDLIHDRTGLFYDDSKRDLLADKLSGRVQSLGLSSLIDYYYHLRYDTGAAEWPFLMDTLSVPETYFWRAPEQVRALVDIIVPRWAETHPTDLLRIWCAGCASGEEPLTVAMALDEAGWFNRLAIRIDASDASPATIAKARAGLYGEWSFRAAPPDMRTRYFQPEGKRWRIDPAISGRVHWSVTNLLQADQIAPYCSASVIFCRNVFIYFSGEAIRKTTRTFWEHMPVPGYLFLGISESLLRITKRFELQTIGDAFVYEKRAVEDGTLAADE